MKNLFIFFGNYFLTAAQDCKTCNYAAQTNEVMEFQVQVTFRHGLLDGLLDDPVCECLLPVYFTDVRMKIIESLQG